MPETAFVWISDYDDGDAARRSGATLLAAGIVAELEEAEGVVGLAVMPEDVDRACEILGVAAPSGPVGEPLDRDEPLPRYRWKIPRERIPVLVVIYGVVILIVTVGVFVLAVVLFGGDLGGGRLDPPSDPSEIYDP